MTLDQFNTLKVWHRTHSRDRPVERYMWDAVLLLWVAGWVGGPLALLTGAIGWALICLGLLFLPGWYVKARRRLHAARLLRCDWLGALR